MDQSLPPKARLLRLFKLTGFLRVEVSSAASHLDYIWTASSLLKRPELGLRSGRLPTMGWPRQCFGPGPLWQKPEMGEFVGTELLLASLRSRHRDRRLQWTPAFTRHVGCFFRYLAWRSGLQPLGFSSADEVHR